VASPSGTGPAPAPLLASAPGAASATTAAQPNLVQPSAPTVPAAPGPWGSGTALVTGPVQSAGSGQAQGTDQPAPLADSSLAATVVVVSVPRPGAGAQPGVDPLGARQASGVPGAVGSGAQATLVPAAPPRSGGTAGTQDAGQQQAPLAAGVPNREGGVWEGAGADLEGFSGLPELQGWWLGDLPVLLRRARLGRGSGIITPGPNVTGGIGWGPEAGEPEPPGHFPER
jgi:hypothetical protein